MTTTKHLSSGRNCGPVLADDQPAAWQNAQAPVALVGRGKVPSESFELGAERIDLSTTWAFPIARRTRCPRRVFAGDIILIPIMATGIYRGGAEEMIIGRFLAVLPAIKLWPKFDSWEIPLRIGS